MAFETDPVRDPATMAAERVLIHGPARKQRLHCCPNGIYHLGVERTHDDEYLHQVVGRWVAPASRPSHHDDRWMVSLAPMRAASYASRLNPLQFLLAQMKRLRLTVHHGSGPVSGSQKSLLLKSNVELSEANWSVSV